MEKQEIIKLFYRNNTMAYLSKIRKKLAYYKAEVENVEYNFVIPMEDMGDADFFYAMSAKHLVRWLQ